MLQRNPNFVILTEEGSPQVARQALSWNADHADLLCKNADLNGFFIVKVR
jgi:hypothetical protein